MPRDGSGNYSQPFPPVETGTEIASTVYNGFTSDITNDLNTARPIVAGGTGATNATDALEELGGEHAQQVVTNYDSHVFLAGSFYSSTSATAGAVAGHAFSGICYTTDADNMFIEARDHDDTAVPARKYVREKDAGVWGAWTVELSTIPGDDSKPVFTGGGTVGFSNTVADMFYGVSGTAPASGFFVNTESDASGTNALGVSKLGVTTFRMVDGNAGVQLNKTGSTKTNDLHGLSNGLNRWLMRLGNEGAESGANAGSNFDIYRWNDAGTVPTLAMQIVRSTGNVAFANDVAVTGALTVAGNATASQVISSVAGTPTQGTYWFGNAGNRLNFDGTNFNFNSGPTVTASGFTASYVTATASDGLRVIVNAGSHARVSHTITGVRAWSTGPINSGVYWINDDTAAATRLSIDTAGTVAVAGYFSAGTGATIGGTSTLGTVAASGHISQPGAGGAVMFSNGYACKPGLSSTYRTSPSTYYSNIDYNATNAGLYINDTLLGLFSYVSDYRTKKDVAELPGTWDRVKALRPIKYTQKEFSPPSHLAHNEQMKAKAKDAKEGSPEATFVEGPLFKTDNVEQWGFVAHELQATLTASAASGVKDAPNEIQSPNPWTVIAALTKALQEAMARIEALEAAK